MATGEDDLTRDVLNRAMDLYGQDQALRGEQRDLGIADVRDIADQLGVPQRYVTAALSQPMIRKPSRRHPTTYTAERYVTHSAKDVKEAGLEYFRRRERMVPMHTVPFGYRLAEADTVDFLGFMEEDKLQLTAFKQVEYTVHKVDEVTSVIRLQADVPPASRFVGSGAGIGAVALGTAFALMIQMFGGSGEALAFAVVGGGFTGAGAGALGGWFAWQHWIDKLESVLTVSINGAADVLDNPLPPTPQSAGQQLAEGAGKIIGAFVRGLGDQKKQS